MCWWCRQYVFHVFLKSRDAQSYLVLVLVGCSRYLVELVEVRASWPNYKKKYRILLYFIFWDHGLDIWFIPVEYSAVCTTTSTTQASWPWVQISIVLKIKSSQSGRILYVPMEGNGQWTFLGVNLIPAGCIRYAHDVPIWFLVLCLNWLFSFPYGWSSSLNFLIWNLL